MKIFLSSDMEGTAGVVAWEQCVGDGPQAEAGRRLLLDEVNAAIEGAMHRAGQRELRIEGDDLLAVYRSFASVILLTNSIAEAV